MEILQPKGVRDFPPEEKILREKVLGVLKEWFERFGFNPLETPVLERYDVLAAKYAGGAEILKETFRLTDQGERELGLRYDLTVPLARFIAMNQNVKLPFKRYAVGTVYRDGPLKLGRYREFYQCDCDIVGANSAAADAQCLQLAIAVFSALQMDVTVAVNSVALLKTMLMHDGAREDQLIPAMLILDKLKKIGEVGVVNELETAGLPAACVHRIIAIAQLQSNTEKVSAIMDAYGRLPELERLQQTFMLVPHACVVFDPSLSRGLAYYTGIVFETFLKNSPITSSISAGGRYDTMIGAFVERPGDFPAVGISFGLEPILEAMKLQGQALKPSVIQVYVLPIKTPQESTALVQTLRAEGIRADIDLLDRGISKNMEYANALAIPYVVIVGRKELVEGMFRLKDMQSGEEVLFSQTALLAALHGKLEGT